MTTVSNFSETVNRSFTVEGVTKEFITNALVAALKAEGHPEIPADFDIDGNDSLVVLIPGLTGREVFRSTQTANYEVHINETD